MSLDVNATLDVTAANLHSLPLDHLLLLYHHLTLYDSLRSVGDGLNIGVLLQKDLRLREQELRLVRHDRLRDDQRLRAAKAAVPCKDQGRQDQQEYGDSQNDYAVHLFTLSCKAIQESPDRNEVFIAEFLALFRWHRAQLDGTDRLDRIVA